MHICGDYYHHVVVLNTLIILPYYSFGKLFLFRRTIMHTFTRSIVFILICVAPHTSFADWKISSAEFISPIHGFGPWLLKKNESRKINIRLRGTLVAYLQPAHQTGTNGNEAFAPQMNITAYFGLQLTMKLSSIFSLNITAFAGGITNVKLSGKMAGLASLWVHWSVGAWLWGFHEIDAWIGADTDVFSYHILALNIPLGIFTGTEIQTVNTNFNIGPFVGVKLAGGKIHLISVLYFNPEKSSYWVRFYAKIFIM
jgi:hypothetical protein